jgi:hypothetical protein
VRERSPVDQVLAESDVISMHCPLTPATRNLIGVEQLRRMKPSAILINTARGGLVDEEALVTALKEGWIAGAGFDVLTTEPPRLGNPLLDLRSAQFHPDAARRLGFRWCHADTGRSADRQCRIVRQRHPAASGVLTVRSAHASHPLVRDHDMKKLLFQIDTDPIPAVFDTVVAYDGGADHVTAHGGITPDNVGPLVDGTIFTRSPKEKRFTAIFVGGSNLAAGEALLKAVQKKFFSNFRVSVMLDSNGSNTTAAAARGLSAEECRRQSGRAAGGDPRRHRPGRSACGGDAGQGRRLGGDHLADPGQCAEGVRSPEGRLRYRRVGDRGGRSGRPRLGPSKARHVVIATGAAASAAGRADWKGQPNHRTTWPMPTRRRRLASKAST